MARYHGKVGFLYTDDNQITGIATEKVVEKSFYGTVHEHVRRWEDSGSLNDDLSLGNQIGIVATDYAFKHASAIAYAEFMGQKWKVTSVRLKPPQIIMTLGGIWNGRPARSSG